MAQGKQTCKILKEIRRQIAEANDIEFVTSECLYKGDCLGTCPTCEAEVRYLEQQLKARRLAGKAVTLAGISASTLAVLVTVQAEAQTSPDFKIMPQGYIPAVIDTNATKEAIPAVTDTIIIKGLVLSGDTLPDGIWKEPIVHASICNQRACVGTITDIDGKFSLSAAVGDSLEVSFIGYETQKIVVTDGMKDLTVILRPDLNMLMGEVVTVGSRENHYLDLYVLDENGNRIDTECLDIERIWINEDGEEDFDLLEPFNYNEKHHCRIYWNYDWGLRNENDKILTEAILRITAEGYEPVIITAEFSEHHLKKTIILKYKE